jgi:hypothetical protein
VTSSLVASAPERQQGALDARDVAVVVGAPDVDHLVEAALELVEVVGDVGGEIGIEAVVALHDAVLLVAEGGGLEPSGAVLEVDVAGLFQLLDGARHHAGVVEAALGEPDVEMHAEFLEVGAAIGQLFGQHVAMDVGPVFAEQVLAGEDQGVEAGLVVVSVGHAGQHGFGRMHVAVAVGLLDLFRHLVHVAALVGVGREGQRLVEQRQVTQPGRHGEDVHLAAGIVDVVLARHLVAGEGQQRRQAGAVGGAAAVADMQRAGGIGGNEFDLQAARHPAVAGRAAPEVAAGGEHGGHHRGARRGRQREVDEAGAGDLGADHVGRHGSSRTRRSATWRGLVFSSRASCMARLLAKSPWLACFGRSRTMSTAPWDGGHAGERGAQEAGEVLAGVEGGRGRDAGCGHGDSRSVCWALRAFPMKPELYCPFPVRSGPPCASSA